MPYHTRSHGVDVPAFQRGLGAALSLAGPAGQDVIYLLPTFQNADGDALVALIGEAGVKAFVKRREILISGIRVHMETARTRRAKGPAILFAVNVSPDQLEKAKADPRVVDWVYVMWSDAEWAAYEAANPTSVVI